MGASKHESATLRTGAVAVHAFRQSSIRQRAWRRRRRIKRWRERRVHVPGSMIVDTSTWSRANACDIWRTRLCVFDVGVQLRSHHELIHDVTVWFPEVKLASHPAITALVAWGICPCVVPRDIRYRRILRAAIPERFIRCAVFSHKAERMRSIYACFWRRRSCVPRTRA